MDCYQANIFDGKVMPTVEQLEEQLRLVALIQTESERRKVMPTRAEMAELGLIVHKFVMNHVFGDLWISLDEFNPQYTTMMEFRARLAEKIAAHSTQDFGSSDEYERSLDRIVINSIDKFHADEAAITAQSARSVWGFLSSMAAVVVPFAAAVYPVAIPLTMLVAARGVFGATEVILNASRIGIRTSHVSVNALACVVNIVAKLV